MDGNNLKGWEAMGEEGLVEGTISRVPEGEGQSSLLLLEVPAGGQGLRH